MASTLYRPAPQQSGSRKTVGCAARTTGEKRGTLMTWINGT
jgi:hypothetical protein